MNRIMFIKTFALICATVNAANAGNGAADIVLGNAEMSLNGVKASTSFNYEASAYYVSDYNFLVTGSYIFSDGKINGERFTNRSYSLGGGLAFSNSLNPWLGIGSFSGLTLSMSNSDLDIGNVSSNDSSTRVRYFGEIALRPRTSFSYSISTPTDQFGDNISYSTAIRYKTNYSIGTISFGMSGSQNEFDGFGQKSTGFFIGVGIPR